MEISKFLREKKVKFDTMTHPEAFTAQEVAASVHVPGREMVKTVLLKADDEYVLAALPAPFKVDMKKVGDLLGVELVSLASEDEMKSIFTDMDIGAEPPFGSLWGLATVVDERLTHDEEIVFQAGSHTQTIRMRFDDFQRIEKPTVGDIALVPKQAGDSGTVNSLT